MNSWDKIYVLCGDSFVVNNELLPSIAKDNEVSLLKIDEDTSLLKSFYIKPRFLVLSNPSTDFLKECLEIIDNGKLACEGLIIKLDTESPDGRLGFYSKAKKNKCIVSYPSIQVTDSTRLNQFLQRYQKKNDVTFVTDAPKFIAENAPLKTIKGDNGKDVFAYDLSALTNELDKVSSIIRNLGLKGITPSSLKSYCSWSDSGDVWTFIHTIISGDAPNGLRILKALKQSEGCQSALYLLLNQLDILVQIKSLQNQGYRKVNDIVENLSLEKILGFYLDNNFEETTETPTVPAINFWRVQKAVESSYNWAEEQLSKQYAATACALSDIRSGANEDLVLLALIMAMSNQFDYDHPMFVTDDMFFKNY